jgi:hypothetical protein
MAAVAMLRSHFQQVGNISDKAISLLFRSR